VTYKKEGKKKDILEYDETREEKSLRYYISLDGDAHVKKKVKQRW
jgi:hypothetical protein